MRAMRLERIQPVADDPGPLTAAEVPRPEPGPGEVRIRVAACGVCHRPSPSLFNDHCRRVIAKHGLQRMRVTGRATAVRPAGGGLPVETTRGAILTWRLLLASGRGGASGGPSGPGPFRGTCGWKRNGIR